MENLKLAPEDYLNMAQSLVAGVLEQCGAQRQIEVELDEDTGGFLIEVAQPESFYHIMAWIDEDMRGYTFSSHKHSYFHSRKGRQNKPIEMVGYTDFLGILVSLRKVLEAKP